ncbi:DUF350 domain-containing protein [Desulfobacterales bacterium HSG17]|nr:DUF350 domain-containing protein [Desulfobacterales bacterium HSG17]
MLTSAILGAAFFVFAFAVSIFTIYMCFNVVMKITKYDDISLIKNNNIAASLVISSSFVAMAIMVKNALYPINAAFQEFWLMAHKSFIQFFFLFGKSLGYLLLTFTLSMVSISSALIIFQKLTKDINEEEEITRNNIAVGLMLAGVLIAFAILIESGISDFVNALIPIRDLL